MISSAPPPPVPTAAPRALLSAPSFPPHRAASQATSVVPPWACFGQHAHALWTFPGTPGCSHRAAFLPACCQASHSLTRAPWPLPQGGCDGCVHNKAPAETIGQECISFRTNTVWAHTIALDSGPRNTFRSSRVRVAGLPQPAHTPLCARDFDAWAAPPPTLGPQSLVGATALHPPSAQLFFQTVKTGKRGSAAQAENSPASSKSVCRCHNFFNDFFIVVNYTRHKTDRISRF